MGGSAIGAFLLPLLLSPVPLVVLVLSWTLPVPAAARDLLSVAGAILLCVLLGFGIVESVRRARRRAAWLWTLENGEDTEVEVLDVRYGRSRGPRAEQFTTVRVKNRTIQLRSLDSQYGACFFPGLKATMLWHERFPGILIPSDLLQRSPAVEPTERYDV